MNKDFKEGDIVYILPKNNIDYVPVKGTFKREGDYFYIIDINGTEFPVGFDTVSKTLEEFKEKLQGLIWLHRGHLEAREKHFNLLTNESLKTIDPDKYDLKYFEA